MLRPMRKRVGRTHPAHSIQLEGLEGNISVLSVRVPVQFRDLLLPVPVVQCILATVRTGPGVQDVLACGRVTHDQDLSTVLAVTLPRELWRGGVECPLANGRAGNVELVTVGEGKLR